MSRWRTASVLWVNTWIFAWPSLKYLTVLLTVWDWGALALRFITNDKINLKCQEVLPRIHLGLANSNVLGPTSISGRLILVFIHSLFWADNSGICLFEEIDGHDGASEMDYWILPLDIYWNLLWSSLVFIMIPPILTKKQTEKPISCTETSTWLSERVLGGLVESFSSQYQSSTVWSLSLFPDLFSYHIVASPVSGNGLS